MFFSNVQPAVDAVTAAHKVNSLQLVWHVNIALLAALALVTLFTLPRAVARFCRVAEWGQGIYLRSLAPRNPQPRKTARDIPTTSESATYSSPNLLTGSEDSHSQTLHSHAHYIPHDPPHRLEDPNKVRHYSLPPHMPMWSSLVHSIASFFCRPVTHGTSLGQIVILVAYLALMMYASFLKSSPFTDPARTGYVAMSQIPVLFILAEKNNIVGMLVGVGYEKLNYLHRFAGWLMFITVHIHTFGYVYKWTLAGDFTTKIREPNIVWGVVATVCIELLVLPSIPFVRDKAYNLFFRTHFLGFSVLLLAVCLHEANTMPYILASACSYILDLVLRALKTRLRMASIRPIPELALTYISIPSLNAGWRAGQHVRLRVLERGLMGRWTGWVEAHPFTIASVAKGSGGRGDGEDEGLVLMCAKAGNWTGRLFELAKVEGYLCESGGETGVRVAVEGPYGGPGHTVFTSYSAAMLVAGGSGITFALSAAQDLIQNELQGRSRLRIIELIWTVQDPSSIKPFLPMFTALINQCPRPLLTISVFYTRAPVRPPSTSFIAPGVTLTPGRPRLDKLLEAIVERALSLSHPGGDRLCGVTVGVCGPVGLSEDVNRAARGVDNERRKAVGGIEVHEEVFG